MLIFYWTASLQIKVCSDVTSRVNQEHRRVNELSLNHVYLQEKLAGLKL